MKRDRPKDCVQPSLVYIPSLTCLTPSWHRISVAVALVLPENKIIKDFDGVAKMGF